MPLVGHCKDDTLGKRLSWKLYFWQLSSKHLDWHEMVRSKINEEDMLQLANFIQAFGKRTSMWKFPLMYNLLKPTPSVVAVEDVVSKHPRITLIVRYCIYCWGVGVVIANAYNMPYVKFVSTGTPFQLSSNVFMYSIEQGFLTFSVPCLPL